MLYSGTDPESYITEYTLVYEEKQAILVARRGGGDMCRSILDPDRV